MLPPEIARLVERGALFVVNHSGGKDSQAMTIFLERHVPAAQLVLVHADLPEVDWEGIEPHIRGSHPGLRLEVCRAVKTFFQMVEHRQMFPSPQQRQCTSDLKRGPITKVILRLLRQGYGRGYLVVNCMGMRAQESGPRAKLRTFREGSARQCVAGREWYEWLPIHAWSEAEVFRTIAEAGQSPHPAYAAGMTRLSCCFCIMASQGDLRTAARLRPELFQRYVATERRLGRTMMMPVGGQRRFLDEIVAGAAR